MSQIAKDFLAKDHLNNEINLQSYKGKKLWLAFYRYASCPLCNLHIHEITQRFNEVRDLDLVFLPIFQSTPSEVQKYAGKNNLPFQIVCDPKEEIYSLYSVNSSYLGFASLSVIKKLTKAIINGHIPGRMEGEVARLPSELLINEDFIITYRYDGKHIGDHPSIDLILEKAKEK